MPTSVAPAETAPSHPPVADPLVPGQDIQEVPSAPPATVKKVARRTVIIIVGIIVGAVLALLLASLLGAAC